MSFECGFLGLRRARRLAGRLVSVTHLCEGMFLGEIVVARSAQFAEAEVLVVPTPQGGAARTLEVAAQVMKGDTAVFPAPKGPAMDRDMAASLGVTNVAMRGFVERLVTLKPYEGFVVGSRFRNQAVFHMANKHVASYRRYADDGG